MTTLPKGVYPLLDILDDYPRLITDPVKVAALDRQGRIDQYFAWARERHAIYLKRHFYKLPAPWSDYTVMAQTRWCNVYRELDKVTKEFMTRVYTPNAGNPNLWFVAMVCRYINHPDSIRDLMKANQLGLSSRWDWRKAAEVLDARKKAGEKFVTGAYLVNSVSSADFPADIVGSKPHVVSYRLSKAWERREELSGQFKGTLEQAYNAFSSVSGFGPFLSYQALVDLTYMNEWLKKAPDYNTFNSAGPGTRRGMQRIKYGRRRDSFENCSQEEVTQFLTKMLELSRDPHYWPQTKEKNPGNGWAPLSLSNLSNCNCETDKWFRLVLNEGETRSKYVAERTIDMFDEE